MRAGGLLLLFSETKELSAHVRCGHTYIPHRATIIHTFRGQDHTHISLHVAPAFILLKPRTRVVEHVVGCRHPRLLPMTVCSRSIGVGGRLEYEVCFFPCSVWPYIHPAPGHDHTYISWSWSYTHFITCGEISSPPPFNPGTSIAWGEERE